MMTNYIKYAYFAPVLALFFVVSCSTPNNKAETAKAVYEEPVTELTEAIQEVVYEVPTPSEIPDIIRSTGAVYNETLVNDINKSKQYLLSSDLSALNLGVYATDIGYFTSYDKAQKALTYMSNSKSLVDNLNAGSSFDERFFRDFEKNIGNRDSLARLLDKTIIDTKSSLGAQRQHRLSALITAGSVVEGLFISSQLVKNYPKKASQQGLHDELLVPVIKLLLKQEKSLSELLEMMADIDENETVLTLVDHIKNIQAAYAAMNIEQSGIEQAPDDKIANLSLDNITTAIGESRAYITR